MKELKLTGDTMDTERKMPINLLNTIKMPRDAKEINQRLPKKKMYNREIEETNLMEFDVNINKKQNDPSNLFNHKENKININLNKVAESKNKEQVQNNLIKMKENNVREVMRGNNPNDFIQKVIENNVATPNVNLRVNNVANNYYSNNNERNLIKNNNNQINAIVRPQSSKNDGRPKTPIQQASNQKNEDRLNPNNMNNYNLIQNRIKPVQLLAGLNPSNNYNSNNPSQVANQNNKINLMKMEGVNVVQAKIDHNSNKNKEVHLRPQSANINHHQVNLNQVKPNLNMNNKNIQEPSKIRANIVNIYNPSDRSKSPNLVIRRNININVPLSANSPRGKSPIREKYLSNQPNIKVNQILNRPVIKSSEHNNINMMINNRNEIQRNNFDVIKLNQIPDPKKNQNYHYVGNSNENVKGILMKDKLMINNKNNPLLNRPNENIQQYQNLMNRPNSNNNNGPKIMVINQRK